MLNVIMLSAILLNGFLLSVMFYCYAERLYAKCRYAECCGATNLFKPIFSHKQKNNLDQKLSKEPFTWAICQHQNRKQPRQ
jgi:hypothetical protein